MTNRFTSVLCISLLLAPFAAHAQSAPETPPAAAAPDANAKKEAARRFEHAIKLYEDSDYVLALAEFERVYELVPDYRVLYNIGQVNIQLGRYARALRMLREYVTRGGNDLPPDRRTAVQADLAFLEARTATVKVDVQPQGAEVSIDGAVVGKAPLAEPVVVDVGERRVQARSSGYITVGQTLTLAGGDWRQITLKLEPEPVAVATPGPDTGRQPSRPAARAPQKKSPWVWVGWGTTGALAVSSGVTAVLGLSAVSELDELRDTPGAPLSDREDAKSRAETRLLVADILGAAAVATGAVTLYFHLSGPKPREQARPAAKVSLGVLPNGVALRLEH